jgi:hypothetical protein
MFILKSVMMLQRQIKLLLLSFFLVFSVLYSVDFVTAQSTCWQYNSTADGCTNANGCLFKNDSWGSWCETLSCWSLYNQTSCGNTTVVGDTCIWQNGSTWSGCEEISCWSFEGTNQSTCESNPSNKSCSWGESCYSTGGFGGGVDCYSITNKTSCTDTTGCGWGKCESRSCSFYTSNTTCNAGFDWDGKNCTWSDSGSYCKERTCYDSALHANKTSCEAAAGINCEWKWGSCQEKSCWSFDQTNATACVNNSIGENCRWEGTYCYSDSCWNSVDTQGQCESKIGCQWVNQTSSGWCENLECWSYDSQSGYNQSDCESNTYSLDCVWSGNPPGNLTSGWCYQDFSSTSCTNISTERECYDSYYCWWQSNDWNNPSAGGNCTEPTWGTGEYANVSGSILNNFNPGCYIFDTNSTKCNLIYGCNFTLGECQEVGEGHENQSIYALNISDNGIKCGYINDSGLCNNIPALSSCCVWQNGTCTTDYYSTSCVSELEQTPNGEVSCEDAESSPDCKTISGAPWYMPCAWDNSSKKCNFKVTEIFGNSSKSIVKIENKRNCEAAGGKWITENYCEGTVSVPTGRCEYKFDEETNCNKACFACEKRNGDGVTVNSTNARSACLQSKLGFCEYESNTGAPNGIGYCKAKNQFKKGVAGSCDSICGDCSYLGDPNSNKTKDSAGNCLSPSCFCSKSSANSAGGGCKWIPDNTTSTQGYCLEKGEKTCENACDRCGSRTNCQNLGRSALNASGSCKWQGGDDDGSCVANVAGDVEICWDGVDNNNDGLIDCGDPSCYSDSWCGFVQGDCFGWTTSGNTSCINNGCEWVNDTWSPEGWCDFKGSQCWKNANNVESCTGQIQINESLDITAARVGLGNGVNLSNFRLNFSGKPWVAASVIVYNATWGTLDGNYSVDYNLNQINFSNTTTMKTGIGGGNYTNISYIYILDNVKDNCEWNAGSGSGWCEEDWSIAETCFTGHNEDACSTISTTDGKNCTWTNDSWCTGDGAGSEWCNGNSGWCDHADFAPLDCWNNYDNSSCSGTTGCSWYSDPWGSPHCEVNWSGGTSSLDSCWSKGSESACTAVTGCGWREYGGGGGTCEPSCFTSYTESACTSVSGCLWKAESGWCQEQQSNTCYNSTNSQTQGNCEGASGCRWNSPGWCDPKGGGFSAGSVSGGGGSGGGTGAECYKYDGNITQCTNSSIINISCGWFPETSPRCEVDWSTECWAYNDAGSCNTGDCYWNGDGFGSGFCTNKIDECWSNYTLQTNATLCDNHISCNSTSFGCEATCYQATTEGTCTVSGCKWVGGWCNPKSMNQIFDKMELGAPTPIGFDNCGTAGETNQSSVDICGFGMKDTGDGYAFGINVYDFSNSSVCNKEKISSHVFESFGGFSGTSSDKTGNGNETISFFVYLDSDGLNTGGCTLSHNTSAKGYDFRFRYSSVWNVSLQKSAETFNAYKCDNSKWIASDIKLSTWKKLMCSEIGGAMIAVQKTDLTRFPKLYDSTADLRVYVATIGNVNTGNVSSPADTAGPGYVTPGAVDFEIAGCFEYGADTAKFEDILKKGFVQYEDCFNGIDDDNDDSIDCADWDCQYSSQCTSTGVNAGGFNDTSTPLVTGVRIEEYPDSALIMYDTNKPSNGTLIFYSNDSRCVTKNATVPDIGATKNNTYREFKLWHVAEVYNGELGFALTNDTTYYYKLKICDDVGKCAVSKCSSFVTSRTGKCGFCNFVTRLSSPQGWSVSYDVAQDGTYEHIQGQVCGPTAGLKTNYTIGRRVNILMNNSDNSNYFEFLNTTLTKTGLNDKVRTFSTVGSFINTSTYVGLDSQTRDKIINNLHPEVCRVKIPFSGTCATLFHCDDNGENCTERTNEATLIDSTNCVWEVPFCEFSTYREAEATTTSSSGGSSSDSGGGGGGGGIASTANNTIDDEVDSVEQVPNDGGETIAEGTDTSGEGSGVEKEKAAGFGPVLWVVVGLLVVGGAVAAYFGVKSGKKKRGY